MTTTYAQFTAVGTSGLLTDGNTSGWTQVDASDFDQTISDSIAAAKALGGRAVPSIDVPLLNSGIAVQVQNAMLRGNTLQIEFASYDDQGRLTTDYVLSPSRLSSDTVDSAGSQIFSASYSAYELQSIIYDPTSGAAQPPVTTGYDFARRQSTSAGTFVAPPSSDALVPDADPNNISYGVILKDASGNVIDSGGVQNPLFPGGFGLPDIAYTLIAPGTNHSAPSASIGFTLAGADVEHLTFFRDFATATPLGILEVLGYNRPGDNAATEVSDTVFDSLLVTNMSYSLLPDGSQITVGLQNGPTYTSDHFNSTGHKEVASYINGQTILTSPPPVADQENLGPHDYELSIGSLKTEISSAAFSIANTGALAFSPLTVTFSTAPSDDVQSALQNININEDVAIEVHKSGGASGAEDYAAAFQFGIVHLSSAPQITDNGDETSSYTYEFSYETIKDLVPSYKPDGSKAPTKYVGWNLITNKVVEGTESVACYCSGTCILTENGEIPVENLEIGDQVITLSGERKPIRWIGRRAYDGRFIAGNRNVLPICIRRGAITKGVPARDLWVSPEHSLYIDDVLVQAKHLINRITVLQAESVEEVEYFHIELDSHDVIYADGMPAETFVDCDNRLMFANGREYAYLYPNDERPHWCFCAPRLEWGSPQLVAIREWMFKRAEPDRGTADEAALHLLVDGVCVDCCEVRGSTYRFELPSKHGSVLLGSGAHIPAEHDAASFDMRRLGVPVAEIVLASGDTSLKVHHWNPLLRQGFHATERTHRWTDGTARIPDEMLRAFSGPLTISITLAEGVRTTTSRLAA